MSVAPLSIAKVVLSKSIFPTDFSVKYHTVFLTILIWDFENFNGAVFSKYIVFLVVLMSESNLRYLSKSSCVFILYSDFNKGWLS